MDAEPLLGAPAATPVPPPRDGIVCHPRPPTVQPAPLSAAAPPAWPRAAQGASAALLLAALALLGWHAYGAARWNARPTALTYRIDLNRADRAQLLQLPGVGEGLAGRIEEYRRKHGGLHSVDELRRVGGIGPVLLEKLRPLVWVEPPQREDDVEASPSLPAPAPQPAKRPGKKAPPTELIDLNRATAAELRRLPGIGPKLSADIIAARNKQPFRRVEDLCKVPRIKAKTLEKLRPYVTVGGEAPAREE
jgi:competence protein ComEA